MTDEVLEKDDAIHKTDIHQKIEKTLDRNRGLTRVAVGLSIGIFLLGAAAIIIGLVERNVFFVIPGTAVSAFLFWPINKVLAIRKENVGLSVACLLIQELSEVEAAKQIVRLVEKLYE